MHGRKGAWGNGACPVYPSVRHVQRIAAADSPGAGWQLGPA